MSTSHKIENGAITSWYVKMYRIYRLQHSELMNFFSPEADSWSKLKILMKLLFISLQL